MLNPAVPSESYDGRSPASDPDRRNMTHPDWKGVASDGSQDYPERVTAAGWSKLFSDDDPRSKITWDNRFGGILDSTDVWQFYSSGEEILHESQGGVPPLLDWPWHSDETVMQDKEWVWVYHEITKGVINDVIGTLIKRHTCPLFKSFDDGEYPNIIPVWHDSTKSNACLAERKLHAHRWHSNRSHCARRQ